MVAVKHYFAEGATHLEMLDQLRTDMESDTPSFDPITNLRLRGLVTTVMAFNALAEKSPEGPQMAWERLSGLSEALLATQGFIAMSCVKGYEKAMQVADEIVSKSLSEVAEKPGVRMSRGDLAILRRTSKGLRSLIRERSVD